MKCRITIFVLFIALIGLLPTAFAFAQESNLDQILELIRQRINEIGQRILELQTKLEIIKKASDKEALIHANEIPKFTKILYQGIAGDEIKQLQEFLKTPPTGGPDIYPEGLVTGYFGPFTKKAVQRWQEKQGIVNSGNSVSSGYGQVGPKTLVKLNELLAEGAGKSGEISQGLLTAPGLQATTTVATVISSMVATTSFTVTAISSAGVNSPSFSIETQRDGLYTLNFKDPQGVREFSVISEGHSTYGGTIACSQSFLTNNISSAAIGEPPFKVFIVDCLGNKGEFDVLVTAISILPIATTTSLTTTTTQPITSEIPIYSSGGGGGGVTIAPTTPAILSEPKAELESESWLGFESDITPPIISDIQAKNIAKTSVTISWITDEPANGKVNYAENSSVADSNNTVNHSLNITNLIANTTYRYIVISTDISGNAATSSENSFTTLLPSLSVDWLEKVKITNSAGETYYPAIAWTGINGGIVWSDYSKDEESEIFFALFDSNGQKTVNNTKISASPILISYNPDIVWSGNKFAVVWAERSPYQNINLLDGCGIFLTILNASGVKQINDVTVAWDNYGACPDQPVITADQTGLDVYWRDSKSEAESGIYHKKYNFDGVETEGETKFTY